ncbi:MAG TPA: FAD-binding protein, partial [Candidatus Acetothermia bacterium]|nr:FAD-binding protein [Candidatus Acetothermia bacterium]
MIREKQVPIAEQPPEERIRNFNEVPFGYTEDEAVLEAERCLQCPTAPCVEGCPVGIDIPRFIDHVKNRRFAEAIATIKEANALPAVCGRVCPQESQCQGVCTLGKRFEPVAIGRLERFCADWAAKNGLDADESIPAATGKKVAVIGSGPAGLTAAGELRKMGHAVTVFELLHAPGGVLMYGIPEFRLPKEIVKREIASLERMGVEILVNRVVGRIVTIDQLLEEGYDAVFI